MNVNVLYSSFTALFCLSTIVSGQSHVQVLPALLGKWVLQYNKSTKIYSRNKHPSKQQEVLVKCNDCPEVTFKSEGLGYVEFSNNSSEFFTWNVSKQYIKILNKPKSRVAFFPDGNYKLVPVIGVDGHKTIELIDSAGTERIFVNLN